MMTKQDNTNDPMRAIGMSAAERGCTCHPDERPEPCEHKYAFRDCWRSAVLKETQSRIVWLKNHDRQPHEQALLDYMMRVRTALEA
jgi:hypothetical protein